MKKIIMGSLVVSSLLVANNNFEINFNSDTVEVASSIYLNDKYILNDNSDYFFDIKYLYSEEKNKYQNTQKLASIGLKAISPYYDDNGFNFGLGINAVIADNNPGKTFFATPLSLYASYEINEKVSINIDGSYAPSILTYSDGDNFSQYNVKVNYQIIDNGNLYVGLRNIKTEYKTSTLNTIEFDDSAYIGFRIDF